MGQGHSRGHGGARWRGSGRPNRAEAAKRGRGRAPPVPGRLTGRRKRSKSQGVDGPKDKMPNVAPIVPCKLRMLRYDRIKDYLLMEEDFIRKMDIAKRTEEEKTQMKQLMKLEEFRGTPMKLGTLEEIIDDNHAIISVRGRCYYVNIMSFVDTDKLELGGNVLLHDKHYKVVGVLGSSVDPVVNKWKLEKAPKETYADVGGLDQQIQEIKEAVELPLTHPEYYLELGIKPPKGVILYGAPGTGKTLLAKAVANQTSATFLRMCGSDLIQKTSGEGPRMVRELFRVAEENSPSIVFIDEIDAVGTKRYNARSSGTREVQRTMLELLNQLDGFDAHDDVKVLLATNRIDSLDPALIRPGRIDRKIEFTLPDEKTKRRIFGIHTSRMKMDKIVDLDEFITAKDELSGADIKAMCTEAGMSALRERRMRITQADMRKAKERVLSQKRGNMPATMYL